MAYDQTGWVIVDANGVVIRRFRGINNKPSMLTVPNSRILPVMEQLLSYDSNTHTQTTNAVVEEDEYRIKKTNHELPQEVKDAMAADAAFRQATAFIPERGEEYRKRISQYKIGRDTATVDEVLGFIVDALIQATRTDSPDATEITAIAQICDQVKVDVPKAGE